MADPFVPFGAPPPMTILSPGADMRAAPEFRTATGLGEEIWDMVQSGKLKHNQRAFDSWMAALPESENIEDRREPTRDEVQGGFNDAMADIDKQVRAAGYTTLREYEEAEARKRPRKLEEQVADTAKQLSGYGRR
jgi:hypothetical protein